VKTKWPDDIVNKHWLTFSEISSQPLSR
jgi:hypothetical protein